MVVPLLFAGRRRAHHVQNAWLSFRCLVVLALVVVRSGLSHWSGAFRALNTLVGRRFHRWSTSDVRDVRVLARARGQLVGHSSLHRSAPTCGLTFSPVHQCHMLLCQHCTRVHFRRALESQADGVFTCVTTSGCTDQHTAHSPPHW